MKKAALLITALAFLAVAGCDNLTAPLENPYAPPPAQPKTESSSKRVLNRTLMEEVFNYTSNVHQNMRAMSEAMSKMDRTTEQFSAHRARFMGQTAEWRLLLLIRHEWMGQGNFGNDHPSRKMALAIYYLVQETYHLDNVYFHNVPLDPKIGEETDKAMREAAKAISVYQDPPGQ